MWIFEGPTTKFDSFGILIKVKNAGKVCKSGRSKDRYLVIKCQKSGAIDADIECPALASFEILGTE